MDEQQEIEATNPIMEIEQIRASAVVNTNPVVVEEDPLVR